MFKRIPHLDQGIEDRGHTQEYETHADRYARLMYGPFLRDLKRLAPSGRCLEVGAGPAVMTCWLARENPGIHITALDISDEMANRGRDRIVRCGLADRIDYQIGDVGDADRLRLLGTFDMVYTVMSMHHWDDAQTGLANLLKAVKNGGRLYVGDLKRVWWLYWVPSQSGLFTSLRAAYQRREIEDMLHNLNIRHYFIRTPPPFLYQAVIIRN